MRCSECNGTEFSYASGPGMYGRIHYRECDTCGNQLVEAETIWDDLV